MKFAPPFLAAAALATAIAASTAASSQPVALTGSDISAAIHVFEHDRSSLTQLVGTPVSVKLRAFPAIAYYEIEGEPDLVVVCALTSGFAGGHVTSTVQSISLTTELGADVQGILTLERCGK
ncbi:hypothetical protein [Xylophilus sp. Leaf220]|uniref:hypothetical protein n=1 Tax=Xylophilus sp. Leaf220 TaxID=1735686 RepID=UPI0006F8D03A|nr:hypothetical protein [Xylophilus sp. Leaf220]KQM79656.1 hypothetical protein ASE76_00090 [Xylophilus sp. Leaf220]